MSARLTGLLTRTASAVVSPHVLRHAHASRALDRPAPVHLCILQGAPMRRSSLLTLLGEDGTLRAAGVVYIVGGDGSGG